MAIYLDDQTRSWLERKTKDLSEGDFIGKRVKGMLEADRARLAEIGACVHTPGEYTGHKTCCAKCGANYEPEMGETWISTKLTEINNELRAIMLINLVKDHKKTCTGDNCVISVYPMMDIYKGLVNRELTKEEVGIFL